MVTGGAVLAWRTQGSLAAPDWLPLAVVAALVVAVVAAVRAAHRPPRPLLLGSGGLLLLAAWDGVSAAWAPSPAGARDEALLAALYAVVLLLPGLVAIGERQRRAGVGVVVFVLGLLAVASAVDVATSATPREHFFFFGRLDFPISYVNGASALLVLLVWPAVVLAARRRSTLLARAAAGGAAGLALALAVSAQSKGTVVGLAVSAVVVLAVAPSRLRLLAPLVLAVLPVAALSAQLTAPYRVESAASARGVGVAALAAGCAAAALAGLYAALDRRVDVGERGRRLAGRTLLGLLAAGIVAGTVVFFVSVPSPARWGSDEWAAFKHPSGNGGSTHLTALGSNRYDFWRVALDETAEHPLRGIGSRGFFSAYLEHRRSGESPLRAHSLYLDTLSETGVPGLALLLLGLGAPLVALLRRRRAPSAVAALGASVYFLTHAAVDWIWTIPAVGVPALLLLGIGATGDQEAPLRRASSLAVSGVGVLLAAFAFAPPWLAYRYVSAAYRSADPGADLAHARTLDPLSLEPDWAQWRLAHAAGGRIDALRRALRQEPRSVAVLFQLGLTYLQADRPREALAVLQRAERLDPRDGSIRQAVARARQ